MNFGAGVTSPTTVTPAIQATSNNYVAMLFTG